MPRTDGLPEPVTHGDQYLAAVLDELRELNATLRRNEPPQGNDGEITVKEVKKKGR